MSFRWFVFLIILAVGPGAWGSEFQTITMQLPKGDAKAGKAAFVELQCHTCHRVPERFEIKAPILEDRGPDLGKAQAKYTAGHLATAILAPSHVVPAEWSREQGKSSMPDYTRVLTVRELIDILAFITTLDDQKYE